MTAKIDLTGNRYGRLIVIKEGEKSDTGLTRWICKCDCGKETLVIGSQLKNGKTKSCGCLRRRKNRENLIGRKFGKLTVIREDLSTQIGSSKWICICDCGSDKEISVFANNLKRGHTSGCGCTRGKDKDIDMCGKKINMLTVIEKAGKTKNNNGEGQWLWKCLCECGDYTIVDGYRLRKAELKSCGCLNGSKHGMSKHPAYDTWKSMISRCDGRSKNSRTYLKKGISVCDEWKNSPVEFLKWADKNGFKKGLQLDRINNDSDYQPNNCRFVTTRENSLNKTQLRSDNRTGYLGVIKKGIGYAARVGRFGKNHYIGSFETIVEAALARDLYIMTNFPEDGYQLNFDFRD